MKAKSTDLIVTTHHYYFFFLLRGSETPPNSSSALFPKHHQTKKAKTRYSTSLSLLLCSPVPLLIQAGIRNYSLLFDHSCKFFFIMFLICLITLPFPFSRTNNFSSTLHSVVIFFLLKNRHVYHYYSLLQCHWADPRSNNRSSCVSFCSITTIYCPVFSVSFLVLFHLHHPLRNTE